MVPALLSVIPPTPVPLPCAPGPKCFLLAWAIVLLRIVSIVLQPLSVSPRLAPVFAACGRPVLDDCACCGHFPGAGHHGSLEIRSPEHRLERCGPCRV